MKVLEVKNVSYDYILPSGVTHALVNVSAEFEKGRLYSVTGRSGSGKSTLLSLMAGFDEPKEGEILYSGRSVKKSELGKLRRESIGIVFQSYNLIPHLTALENVILAIDISKKKIKDKRKAAMEALESVGLDKSLFKKFPMTLSGGEQQRVAIARAIVTDPDIILADEPTGNLDNENSDKIVSLLSTIAHDSDRCVIVVTHSREVADKSDVEYILNGREMKAVSHLSL